MVGEENMPTGFKASAIARPDGPSNTLTGMIRVKPCEDADKEWKGINRSGTICELCVVNILNKGPAKRVAAQK